VNTSPKAIKYIHKVKSPLIRPCPGAKNHLCCNYVVISHILGCPFNCSYCYLHTFFGKDEIVVYEDTEKIIAEVKGYMEKGVDPLRIGTGEFSDSLALPEAAALGEKLVKLFAGQDKHLLELKTKSVNVDGLLILDHRGQTVVAWSVNPELIIRHEEHGAASLKERLEAARKVVAAGYRVAFHFDPVINFPRWENEYQRVIDLILEAVPERSIAWVSLGALRFPAAQKKIMEEKLKSNIDFSFLESGSDTKLRYSEELRIELLGQIYRFWRSRSKDIYIYLCMETEKVWSKIGINNQPSPYFKFQLLLSAARVLC
jgi:spore photoproduct lyase